MTEKERMLAGKLYIAESPELAKDAAKRASLLRKIRETDEPDTLHTLFADLLGSVGEHFWIQPPFYCDYGSHIHIGEHFYANYDCVMLDVCDITIGDHVLLAPRVCIYTAAHPIDAEIRNTGLEFGKPVKIGSSVWIGGSTVINPGVTIGDNVVIGSGSVVTKDIPSGVVAAGNPCRVLRPITEEDKTYWSALAEEYYADRDK